MYEVRRGDYCYKIAQDNGISYDQLLRQNPGLSCVNLQVGQSICLIPQSPSWDDWKGNSGWNDWNNNAGARNLDSCRPYVVKEGDLCSRIAAANGLTFSELVDLNENTPNWNETPAMSLSVYFQACKSMLGYFIGGKMLPSWDMEIQVFCDVVRHRNKQLFPESSDKTIDDIDYDKIHEGFAARPMPPSKLSIDVGVYCAHNITVSDCNLNPDWLPGIGVAEDPLRSLIEQDTTNTSASRQIPGELLACWSACAVHGIHRNSHERALEMRPLADTEKIVLCLHGGSYVTGSPASHREVLGKLTERAKLRCFIIDYRLAPKHPFPAQLHDAFIAFQYLVNCGFKPHNIVLAGDSAGGHLCINLVLLLRHIAKATDKQLMPAGVMLFSPLPGIVLHGASLHANTSFDYICPTPLEWPTSPLRLFYKPGKIYNDEYRQEICDPLLTPAFGDLSEFPPTIIQSGSSEILIDDIRELYEKLKLDNPEHGRILWEEYPEMVHVFHRFLRRPESQAAFDSLAKFIASL
ncbi:hypothetical protein IWW56_003054 [Coemansia sp. RSA 2131]|nr:hypothetical protein IWW56_003054 [Coemansia sp. RSA 2131]